MVGISLDRDNLEIVCPYCGNLIQQEWVCKRGSDNDQIYIYLCSQCEEILGIYRDKIESKKYLEKSLKTR